MNYESSSKEESCLPIKIHVQIVCIRTEFLLKLQINHKYHQIFFF